MGDLVPIFSAADLVQAQLLREHLAEHDIQAWIINEALTGAVGELPPGWMSSPRVVVASPDAVAARQLAVRFEGDFVAGRQANAPAAPRAATEVDDWPRCLMCGEPRLAVCRFCGAAGTNFPRAFQPARPQGAEADDEPAPLLVVCPTCDEPFTPRFYQECEHCGYEFEDGLPVRHPTGDLDEIRLNQFRVWLVMGSMLLLFVACGLYLWWLMNHS